MPAITIEVFFKNWIESRKGKLSPSRWVKYEATVHESLNYMGGKTRRGIDTLTKANLVLFRDSVAERTRAKTAS